jgi:hypothetical protein
MSQWGRFLAKRTNLAFLNEINAIRFPCRNRLSFSARRIKRRRQSRSGAHVVKEATARLLPGAKFAPVLPVPESTGKQKSARSNKLRLTPATVYVSFL